MVYAAQANITLPLISVYTSSCTPSESTMTVVTTASTPISTTVIAVTPNVSPVKSSPKLSTPSSPTSPECTVAPNDVSCLTGTGVVTVRTSSGHVQIRTFEFPQYFIPKPRDLVRPKVSMHSGGYYVVWVGQECGIFLTWYATLYLY
jgi:hypothetical protein